MTTQDDSNGPHVDSATGSGSEARSPDDAWLVALGTGASQLARVCARGAKDRVAKSLCDPAISLAGLDDLYRALRLTPADDRFVAVTTHSLGLSARTVSAANPRVVVFPNTNVGSTVFPYEDVIATAFSRGEQLVELVGLDPETYEYNFYLLRFDQACSASRCTAQDLLSEQVERSWTGWTLYSDADLEDTPLDCLSCHLPFGEQSHKLLLMRQVIDPWMHWGDFRGGDETLCLEPRFDGVPLQTVATADGLDLLRSLEGEAGHYAAVPVAELVASPSGDRMSDFLVDAENLIHASPHPQYPYAQVSLPTRETLCERFKTGTSPTWERDREASLLRGYPFPYYAPDVLDPERRAELASGRTALYDDSEGVFERLSSLHAAEVAPAVGFIPREQDSAPMILKAMCGRCHAPGTSPQLARSGFDAELTGGIDPHTYESVRTRLHLPSSAPEHMPPRRAGELPSWAVDRVLAYLAESCTSPGDCR